MAAIECLVTVVTNVVRMLIFVVSIMRNADVSDVVHVAILLASAQSVCTVIKDMEIAPVNPIVINVNKCSVYADIAITAHFVSTTASVSLVNAVE